VQLPHSAQVLEAQRRNIPDPKDRRKNRSKKPAVGKAAAAKKLTEEK